ncbi:hypothetical protein WS84_17525 [Burkholderia anthina]|uniref:hypothetical protein n=1 Tax=Burkholderia anthina TaxID=179879 RepID=UPI00075A5795|nr:hypothetical protein [Burkholderia anthina]KVH04141.1 hypothetical protein WS85_29490 [Burkholderia anthina]KVH09951.1 hypothetical protein WS84_17525 [Burkholderia anthina]KVM87683.1 hypothetical protein WT06_22315 [Burkholderia anthina]KVX38898.1 hypothetical protein WT32_07280 [Burkholderia anthina]
MNEIKHTLGQAWLQRAKELAQDWADSSFAYGELPSDAGETESADAYARSLAADRSLDAHLQPMAHLIDALHLVASKTVLTSGIRAVVDDALAKAGFRAPMPVSDPVRHITIAGVDR